MINEHINIFKDVEALCEGFSSFLKEELAENEHINLSLSGGSTPKALFKHWSEKYQIGIDWKKISFFWGDERCVPPDNEMSNYGMTRSLLFDKVRSIRDSNIHRILGENEPEDEARRYSDVLENFLAKENGTPIFDVLMLGLGDDGHTVSIFPHQIELWNSNENCIVAHHPETGMSRVSLSGKIVNSAHNVVFLVTGKSKAEKVKEIILQRNRFMNTYPAARVNPAHGNLYWFLDEDAASLL